MRILFITPFYPPIIRGGIATYSFEIVKRLISKGHEVVIFQPDFRYNVKNTYTVESSPENVRIYKTEVDQSMQEDDLAQDQHYVWGRVTLNTLPVLKDILKSEERFDVVHINDDYCAMYIEYLKYVWKLPIVCTMHSAKVEEGDLEDSIKRYMLASVDNTIMISNYIYKFFAKRYGNKILNEMNSTLIYPGVEIGKMNNEVKKQKVLFCGRLSKVKNASELIEMAARFRNQGTKLEIEIIGDGTDKKALEKMVQEKQIEDSVSFLGFLPQKKVREKMSEAAIFISTSKEETFGFTIVEAMAEGACVISSSVGAIPEYINNEENGFLYTLGNIEELEDKVKKVLNNYELQKNVRENAINTIKEYSWDKAVDKIEKLYLSVLENKKRV